MNYIFDVLLNFNDDDNILEFFEWRENDCNEHIKKIPIFRISPQKMQMICNNKIRVNREFLKKIENETVLYKSRKPLEYACLITDYNKVIGLEFLSDGTIVGRSGLLLDEEEDIIDECEDIEEEDLVFEIVKPYKFNYFLTRSEKEKQKYLLTELKCIKDDGNIEKFNFLYLEIFKKDNLTFEQKYQKMFFDIKDNYTDKYNKLYELIRLTYVNKKSS